MFATPSVPEPLRATSYYNPTLEHRAYIVCALSKLMVLAAASVILAEEVPIDQKTKRYVRWLVLLLWQHLLACKNTATLFVLVPAGHRTPTTTGIFHSSLSTGGTLRPAGLARACRTRPQSPATTYLQNAVHRLHTIRCPPARVRVHHINATIHCFCPLHEPPDQPPSTKATPLHKTATKTIAEYKPRDETAETPRRESYD